MRYYLDRPHKEKAMKAKPVRVATQKEFLKVINSRNIRVIVIVGHIMFEGYLELAISEILAHRHLVELQRVPFPLKLDLAIALRLLPLESRPAFIRFNALRNKFAHDWRMKFKEKDKVDFLNCLSPMQRRIFDSMSARKTDRPIDVLTYILAALYAELRTAITRIRDEKTRMLAIDRLVRETVATGPYRDGDGGEVTEEVEREVQEARKKRAAAGEF